VDFVGGYEREEFREGDTAYFDLLVIFRFGDAVADVACEVDLHPLTEEAGAGEVFGEEGPALGAVAGLFDHLALCGGEGGFAGFDAAGGEFEEELSGGVTVLALDDDVRVLRIFGLVDGEDDYGAAVTDDFADIAGAAWLNNCVREDGEGLSFEGELGGAEAGCCFAGLGWLRADFFTGFEAAEVEAEVVGRGFFFESAIRLRYHPATSYCIGDKVVGIQPGA
jgi:hypothetical protein